MLSAFDHPFARCTDCDVLRLKFETGQIFNAAFLALLMLHDVVVVWPGSCNNDAPGHAHWFDFQCPTCRNTSQQGDQTCATCCALDCCDILC